MAPGFVRIVTIGRPGRRRAAVNDAARWAAWCGSPGYGGRLFVRVVGRVDGQISDALVDGDRGVLRRRRD